MVRRIGFVDLSTGSQRANQHPAMADLTRGWAERNGFTSVVWTDLPSNFESDERGGFSVEAALDYLRQLPEEGRLKAKEYIDRAPTAVRTPLRAALDASGWWSSYGAT